MFPLTVRFVLVSYVGIRVWSSWRVRVRRRSLITAGSRSGANHAYEALPLLDIVERAP